MIHFIRRHTTGLGISLGFVLTLILAGTVFAEDTPQPEIPLEPEVAETVTASDVQETTAETPTFATDPAPEIILTTPLPEIPSEAAAVLTEEISQSELKAEPSPVEFSDPLADVVEELAEINITLADENSKALELASQSSADKIAISDPYFKVGSVTYRFLAAAGGCTLYPGDVCSDALADPIMSAINYISTNGTIPTDHKIYIESGTFTNAVEVNGTQPYLNQLGGLIGVDTGTGLPLINNTVYVHDTITGFELNGFTINAATGSSPAVRFDSNTGTLELANLIVKNTAGSGITVSAHTGKVIMDNVISTANFGIGAIINNTGGIFPITISNSEFEHNNDGSPISNYGLLVQSHGLVTLNYVASNHNNGHGAQLSTEKGVTVKNSIFNLNYASPSSTSWGWGLFITNSSVSNNVYLENVQADGNDNYGFYLYTGGVISAKTINASGNKSIGMFILNPTSNASLTINKGTFTGNTSYGLYVNMYGNILLSGMVAASNSNTGVYLDNCQFSGSACPGSGTVQIVGTPPNLFIDNVNYGLQIFTFGNVTLTNIEASDNISSGIQISNDYIGSSGGVTIKANYVPLFGAFANILHHNSGFGLEIDSYGTISIDKMMVDSNTLTGIDLDNSGSPTAKTITLKNIDSWLNSNGIVIASKGNVILTNCAAYDNTPGKGLDIVNSFGTGNVTVGATSTKDFGDNSSFVMDVESKGAININHVYGYGSLYGSRFFNNSATSAKSITITDSEFSKVVNSNGVTINSVGPIVLRNIIANINHNYGLSVNSFSAATNQPLTMTNVEISGNGSVGAYITVAGNVKLSGVRALRNTQSGLYIDTCNYSDPACRGFGSVTLSGTGNEFSGNVGFGIHISSGGAVSLSNLSCNYNTYDGLYVYNSYDGSNSPITVTTPAGKINEFRWNKGSGLSLDSNGAISVTRAQGDDNVYAGAYIVNPGGTPVKNITITESSFSHNQDNGLSILTKGLLTLKAVIAQGNTRYNSSITSGSTHRDGLSAEGYMYDGGKWESWWYNGSGVVKIQLRSTEFTPIVYLYDDSGNMLAFDDNPLNLIDANITFTLPILGDYRIEVAAKDSDFGIYDLALNNDITTITYAHMNQYGLSFHNSYDSGDVTILASGNKGNVFNYNAHDGVYINFNGKISISKAEANFNEGSGFYLYNNLSPLPKNISLTSVSANNNRDEGVNARSTGSITWNGGGASQNRISVGALLDNTYGTIAKPVTVSNTGFNDNFANNGLNISSLGNITLTNTSAMGNEGSYIYGAYLDNCIFSAGACLGSGKITITGLFNGNGFNGNGYSGLAAYSFGNIRFINSEANGNGSIGVNLYNDYAGSTGSVTVSGTSAKPAKFNNNLDGSGLFVTSRGSLSINYAEADGNVDGYGIYAINSDAVTAQGANLTRLNADGNSLTGILLESTGIISASYLNASRNGNSGVYLSNNPATTPLAINISRSEASENSFEGIYLDSNGKVTLNAIKANKNLRNGLYINTDGDVTVLSTQGENSFSNNVQRGLFIFSAAGVSLSKVTADWNGMEGLYISTATTLSINTASFQHNGYDGINASLSSNANITKALVISNGGETIDADGIFIITSNPANTVSILNSMATGQEGSGIHVHMAGSLVLTGTYYLGNDTNGSSEPNVDWS